MSSHVEIFYFLVAGWETAPGCDFPVTSLLGSTSYTHAPVVPQIPVS